MTFGLQRRTATTKRKPKQKHETLCGGTCWPISATMTSARREKAARPRVTSGGPAKGRCPARRLKSGEGFAMERTARMHVKSAEALLRKSTYEMGPWRCIFSVAIYLLKRMACWISILACLNRRVPTASLFVDVVVADSYPTFRMLAIARAGGSGFWWRRSRKSS